MSLSDSMFDRESSVHNLPDEAPKRDAPEPQERLSELPETNEEVAKPDVDKQAASAKGEVDDEDSDIEPSELEGYKKALKAARGDKRKMRKAWQEADRKLAEFEGRMAAMSQMQQHQGKPQEPVGPQHPDFYADPEAHLTAMERSLMASIEDRDFRSRANMSEELISEKHEDYDQAKRAFISVASQPGNQWMWNQVTSSALPAKIVYREGKKLLGGGPDEEIKKLRQEIEQLKSGRSGSVESDDGDEAPVRSIPKSIAGARGSGASAKESWAGPRTAKEIFGR